MSKIILPLESKLLSSSNLRNDLDMESHETRRQLPAMDIKKFFALETASGKSGSSNMEIEGNSERSPAGGGVCYNDDMLVSPLKNPAFTSSSETHRSVSVSRTKADDMHLDNMEDAVEGEEWKPPVCDRNDTFYMFSGDEGERFSSIHVPHAPVVIPPENTSIDCAGNHQTVKASEPLLVAAGVPVGGSMHHPLHSPQGRKDCLVELYYRGVKTRNKLEEKWATIRAARENAFKAYSFQPTITKRAKAIPRRGNIPRCSKHDTRLCQHLLLEAWKPEADGQCQPIPTISKGSERIVRRVRGNSATVIPVEERLHLDSARRRYRMEEEAVKPQISLVKRTPDDIKAHIDRLYMYEARRQLALHKLREELDAGRCQASLHVNGEDVVGRLVKPMEKTRCRHSMDEEELCFAPQLSSGTEELSLRARRRRVDEWYMFFTRRRHEDAFLPNAVAEKIREALRQADLSRDFSRTAFGLALDEYEKKHGAQLWHLTPPPLAPTPNEELTFAPRINNCRRSQESAQTAHERLFSAAKKQQLAVKEEEERVRLEDVLKERRRKEKQQRQGRQARALSAKKTKLLEKPGSTEEEGRSSPSLLPPSDSPPSIADASDECEVFVVSPTSDTSGPSDSTSLPVEVPTMSAFSHVLDAAKQLQNLIDAPEEGEENSMSSFSPRREEASFVECPEPVLLGDTPQVAAAPPESSASRVCGSKSRALKKMRVSTDILLECALSRLTWSADVATRRREWRESRRRLQGVGKMLYQKM
ncbi:hypothetical protein TraAM80_06718 [Trypanosoma rangeli]|uniref:Uncharacterized protein n=1 Tax=Trypanosoma rangeli TaxID=5698 RepID=A0A3R7MG27_TRYRA|nr:uncharacterized protein TraAM80_06718 [Trypanosoma rangeli]RNF01877.1 hypothetical protein TraAM80_06718 [Trypanosoma rangeli]|eukprot:RNF01877.1 hypothetical protein TraAM80_06718 [Trypanosoma rangeli]